MRFVKVVLLSALVLLLSWSCATVGEPIAVDETSGFLNLQQVHSYFYKDGFRLKSLQIDYMTEDSSVLNHVRSYTYKDDLLRTITIEYDDGYLAIEEFEYDSDDMLTATYWEATDVERIKTLEIQPTNDKNLFTVIYTAEDSGTEAIELPLEQDTGLFFASSYLDFWFGDEPFVTAAHLSLFTDLRTMYDSVFFTDVEFYNFVFERSPNPDIIWLYTTYHDIELARTNNNRISTSTVMDDYGFLIYETEFSYDSNGNISVSKFYNTYSKLIAKAEYTWERGPSNYYITIF